MNATPGNTSSDPEQIIADLRRQLAERETEHAECKAERDEALAQQTATVEVLGVINSSPGNLAPVFDALLEKATRLCEASCGNLYTYDGGMVRTVAVHGEPRLVDSLHRLGSFRPSPGVPIARLLDGEPFLRIADLTEEEAYKSDPGFRGFVDMGGLRSSLIVALRKDEKTVGVLHLYRQEVRPFTDKQIALLQNFAAQAVIAMENARLLTETREALQRQTATAEVLQVINAQPGNLTPVFDAILEKAHGLCGVAQGSLELYDGQNFRAVAMRGVADSFAAQLRQGYPASDNPATRPLIEGQPFSQILDVTQHKFPFARPHGSARTLLCVPLRADDKLLGMIACAPGEVRPFTDKQIALLQNFAAQAVIAMENARLLTETREALEQQTATAEVLQVINASPGNLAPVFEAMLEKATRLCEAPFGNLRTWDGERFHFGAVYGDPQFSDWVRRRRPLVPDRNDDSPLGQIIKGKQVVRFTVAPGDEGRWTSAGFKEMVEISGMRSGIAVALNKDEALLGTISVYRQEVRPFSDKQIGLLQNFAAQAVIAIENARLLGELQHRTAEVAELNRGLEARVAEQVEELGRVGRLKRFLAPQLAELIVSQDNEQILESHRREIVVVFCDLRGYTAFSETAEPEEVLDFLRDYHGALGPLVARFEGTLDQFSGDGIMVFFNDPVPIPNPAERAVNMAVAMREAAGTLIADWRERGRDLGFGSGVAQGYATLGQIGFSERSGYTAIGTVCNVAARLCAEAKDGQILLSQRVNAALRGSVVTEQVGALALKGLTQPVVAYNVPPVGSQAAFRVIDGGPPSA
jgi:class 3 adenylate cyclase/putative methionine-R-sulfoxide reductase with GAF domain